MCRSYYPGYFKSLRQQKFYRDFVGSWGCQRQEKKVPEILNFLNQLVWAWGPDIWLKTILDVSVSVFLDEIYINQLWVKQIAIPNTGGPHPMSWMPWLREWLTSFPEPGELSSSAIRLHLQHRLFLVLRQTAFRLKLQLFPECPACQFLPYPPSDFQLAKPPQ